MRRYGWLQMAPVLNHACHPAAMFPLHSTCPTFIPCGCLESQCAPGVACAHVCQAEKRRETLVVGLSKTKDQLSVTEEKYKSLQLEMQRTQMDLVAKTSRRHKQAAHVSTC